jgi:hypothetical protein
MQNFPVVDDATVNANAYKPDFAIGGQIKTLQEFEK